ncbi:hypothetical protein, partial [Burkholderia ambifaria]|uniref:hypothetical protein n=1 Tax=Burkholderia ambifaria TaxID=152480 RepID=UPI001E5DA66E
LACFITLIPITSDGSQSACLATSRKDGMALGARAEIVQYISFFKSNFSVFLILNVEMPLVIIRCTR